MPDDCARQAEYEEDAHLWAPVMLVLPELNRYGNGCGNQSYLC
jgi:hypothetical protein